MAVPHNNFQTLVKDRPARKMGAVLARAPLAVLDLEEWSHVDFPRDWNIANTMSWIGSYYLDFGPIGVVCIPFLLGSMMGTLFRRLANRPTLGRLLTYAVLAEAAILSPSTDRFFDAGTIFIVGVLMAVGRVSRRQDRDGGLPGTIGPGDRNVKRSSAPSLASQ